MTDIIILNRNLRLLDNAALYYGSLKSNFIVIYLYDVDYWKANGKSSRQLKFSNDCLEELDEDLKKLNSNVNVFNGSFYDLGKWIETNYNNFSIHINHCTDVNYFREGFNNFKENFKNKITVYDDFGLQLNNFDRDTWSKNWNHIMNSDLLGVPKPSNNKDRLNLIGFSDFKNEISCEFSGLSNIQKGGTSKAKELLETFLDQRCKGYRIKMSSPSQSEESCSRLSPHFTYGSISIRQVYQLSLIHI